MKKYSNIIALLIAAALVTLFLVYKGKSKVKNHYIWEKTYGEGSTQPYDFGLFRTMLDKRCGGKLSSSNGMLIKPLQRHTENVDPVYVFIGRYYFMNREEIDSLMNFAARGNGVMIISEGLPDTLLEALSHFAKPVSIDRFDATDVDITSERLSENKSDFSFTYLGNKKKPELSDWYYINEEKQLDYYFGETGNRYIVLSRINKKVNHAAFKVGAGFIHIHTSPLLFTNIALCNDSVFRHVNDVFNAIGSGPVLYDIGSREYKEDSEKISRRSDSPLTYILRQPALKAAWYLGLTAILLFFLFRARRQQRLVPVIEAKKNTTLAFIDTMSGLYFNQGVHRKMAELKMQMFLYFVRHKLNIATKDLGPAGIKLIAEKARVPLENTEAIFRYYEQKIKNGRDSIDADVLLELNNRIQNFYTIYHSKK